MWDKQEKNPNKKNNLSIKKDKNKTMRERNCGDPEN